MVPTILSILASESDNLKIDGRIKRAADTHLLKVRNLYQSCFNNILFSNSISFLYHVLEENDILPK